MCRAPRQGSRGLLPRGFILELETPLLPTPPMPSMPVAADAAGAADADAAVAGADAEPTLMP